MKNLHSVFKIILRSTPPHYDSSTPSGWFTCCHLPSYLYSCCSAHLKCFIFTHHPPILQTIPHPSQLRSCGSPSYNPSLAIHSLHSLFFCWMPLEAMPKKGKPRKIKTAGILYKSGARRNVPRGLCYIDFLLWNSGVRIQEAKQESKAKEVKGTHC